MAVQSAHKTDTGRVAKHNQDYVWVDEERGIYIVADGMGGHEAGDVASRMAATMIGETLAGTLTGVPLTAEAARQLITDAIEKANRAVRAASAEAHQTRRMGATVVMAVVRDASAFIAHAGDARAYLIRGGTLSRLTEDDSWVAHLIATGVLAPEEEKQNRLSHVVTKAVGQESPVNPAFAEVPLSPGDWLLLCSDGLWNMVDDEDILSLLHRSGGDPAQAVEALTQAANDAGGRDNISVIALKVM